MHHEAGLRRQRGFTLVEVMIVVAILAIIAAFAFPNFAETARKTRRSDAYAGLQQAAALMEKGYMASRAYDDAALGASGELQSPEGYYTISAAVDGRTYTLRAEPVAGGPQAADAYCTAIILASSGAKSSEGDRDNALDCWRN